MRELDISKDESIKGLLLDSTRPRDIESQDGRASIFFNREMRPSKPYVTAVLVNNVKTTAILWWSDVDDKPHYYPISDPNCREFELINPNEFDVIFLGTIEQLLETSLSRKLAKLPTDQPKTFIAILAINHLMYGYGGRSMNDIVFPCCVVMRINHESKVVIPKAFCLEQWPLAFAPPHTPPGFPKLSSLCIPNYEEAF